MDVTFDLDLDVELECKTIVQLAVENPDLSTLVTAITTAGLAETLSGDGPFTVFAPLDTGFDALPEGTVANLLEPEKKEQLTGLLLGHVVAGIVKSDDLEDGPVPTLNGDAVEVKGAVTPVKINQAKAIAPPERKYSSFKINDANVKKADIEACNGVIHLIDAVLLPAMPKGKKFGCLECMCRHWSFLFLFPILILRPFSYIHLSNQCRRLHHLLIL